MTKADNKRSSPLSRFQIRLGGALVLTLVALLDYYTGAFVSLVLLYLIPVAYVSYYDGRAYGLLFAIVSGVIHLTMNLVWFPQISVPIRIWNGIGTGGILVAAAISLDYVRRSYQMSLTEAETKYTRIVESAIEGIVATDPEWNITFANKRSAELLGYRHDQLRGMNFFAHLADHAPTEGFDQRAGTEGEESVPFELELKRKDGTELWVLVSVTTTRSLNGKQDGRVLLLTDITELKDSEQELRRRYREISAMQRLSSGLSQSLNLSTQLENSVETVLDVTGFDAAAIYLADDAHNELSLSYHRGFTSMVFAERTHKWPVGRGITGHVAKTGVPHFIEDAFDNPLFDSELKNSENVHGFAAIPVVSKEKVLGVLCIISRVPRIFSPGEQLMLQTLGKQIGISVENARLYEMARQRERQIRRLSIDLVQVQEEERRRFARELHDGLSQVLTTLKINSELALKSCGVDNEITQKHLREVITLSNEAQHEAKQIAYDLRPAILDDFGLKAAITLLATTFERRAGITVELHMASMESRFGSLIETTIYRIVQELMTNVAKHAKASKVTIQLLVRGSVLALTVADNGSGLDPKRTFSPYSDQPHYGLRNVRERVEFLGGMFRIESNPGQGAEFMIELPVGEPVSTEQRKEKMAS